MHTINKILLVFAIIAFILAWILESIIPFTIGALMLGLMYFFADDDYDNYEGI